jgi:hypothetical protein
MIKVFHNGDFLKFGLKSDSMLRIAAKKIPVKDLQLVATVDTESLDIAYELTNNIDGSWTENENVRSFIGCVARSSSIGDILEKDGKKYIVARVGFIEI